MGNKTLPQTINGFGYMLYANRIVITFGGSIQRNKFIDNIYYTDILNVNDSWKEASIKCPKKGGYHAILISNQIVHLIHFGKEQFCMNIKDLLPQSIISNHPHHAPAHHSPFSQHHANNNNNNDYESYHHSSSNVLRAAQSVQQINTSLIRETPDLKQLLMEYQNTIQTLQSDNHRLKLDNAMFKSQIYAFQQDKKQKEFTIAKLQKDISIANEKILSMHSSNYKSWDSTQIINWIINLENGRFKQYNDELNKSLPKIITTGHDLQYLSQDQLDSFGIFQFNDKISLHKHIKMLTSTTLNSNINHHIH